MEKHIFRVLQMLGRDGINTKASCLKFRAYSSHGGYVRIVIGTNNRSLECGYAPEDYGCVRQRPLRKNIADYLGNMVGMASYGLDEF